MERKGRGGGDEEGRERAGGGRDGKEREGWGGGDREGGERGEHSITSVISGVLNST